MATGTASTSVRSARSTDSGDVATHRRWNTSAHTHDHTRNMHTWIRTHTCVHPLLSLDLHCREKTTGMDTGGVTDEMSLSNEYKHACSRHTPSDLANAESRTICLFFLQHHPIPVAGVSDATPQVLGTTRARGIRTVSWVHHHLLRANRRYERLLAQPERTTVAEGRDKPNKPNKPSALAESATA